MANQNQPVRACILKVEMHCTGCLKRAKTKLESISGVSAVDYNKEKGLMTVTGNVEPMTLVKKLIRHGKKTELVSVKYKLEDDKDHQMVDEEEEDTASDTSSYSDIKTQEVKEKENDKSKKTKWCLWKKSKPKEVQSLKKLNSQWHVPSKFENGFGPGLPFGGYGNPYAPMMWGAPMMQPQGYHPPMMQQQCYYPMMQQQAQLQPKPQVPTTGAAKPQNANNIMPQQPIPYYETVNPKLHYPEGKK